MATAGKNLSAYDEEKLPDAKNFKFGIVVSEWNEDITDNLHKGALQVFLENKVKEENIVSWHVPGSFELTYGCKRLQQTHSDLDAIIAVGSVIKGETKHFDFVCQAVSQGIKDLNVHSDIPVIFCVLTDNNKQQAIERSGGKHGNKGAEAAVASIKMAQLRKDTE
ncbi:MAG TPA: 6,7-dimethyl-8-ribityllumazine synthase [Flavobacteriaceae bacterium]|nr:6,7-dimethyl-8-ribityllumazine synthase [Flavobacteriaceae bacterium]